MDWALPNMPCIIGFIPSPIPIPIPIIPIFIMGKPMFIIGMPIMPGLFIFIKFMPEPFMFMAGLFMFMKFIGFIEFIKGIEVGSCIAVLISAVVAMLAIP